MTSTPRTVVNDDFIAAVYRDLRLLQVSIAQC